MSRNSFLILDTKTNGGTIIILQNDKYFSHHDAVHASMLSIDATSASHVASSTHAADRQVLARGRSSALSAARNIRRGRQKLRGP
jgi:hypothetical protein